MTERHKQSADTRAKIGNSVVSSGWRQRTKEKGGDLQSSTGAWEEDFRSPSIHHPRRRFLWEEYSPLHGID